MAEDDYFMNKNRGTMTLGFGGGWRMGQQNGLKCPSVVINVKKKNISQIVDYNWKCGHKGSQKFTCSR